MSPFLRQLLKSNAAYAVIILVLIIFLFILRADINGRSGQIIQKKTDFAVRSQSVKSLSVLRSEYEKALPSFDFLENILPARDQAITFAKDLEGFAGKYRLEYGFTFGSEAKSTVSAPGSVDFRISMGGTYDNIINFLKNVDKSRYFIYFSSMDLSKAGGDSFTSVVTGSVFTR